MSMVVPNKLNSRLSRNGSVLFGGYGSLTTQLLTLDGVGSYAELAAPIALISADTFEIPFATSDTGVSQYLCDLVQFDAGDLLQLTNCTATIDGNAVSDGASIASYRDGKLHTFVGTMTASDSITMFGQNGAGAGFFNGPMRAPRITANSVVYHWGMDSGSTTGETAKSGGVDIIYNGVSAAHWESMTYKTNIVHDAGTIAAGWVGQEMFDPQNLSAGSSAWRGSSSNTDYTVTSTAPSWYWYNKINFTGSFIYTVDVTSVDFPSFGIRVNDQSIGTVTAYTSCTAADTYTLVCPAVGAVAEFGFEGRSFYGGDSSTFGDITISKHSMKRLLEIA